MQGTSHRPVQSSRLYSHVRVTGLATTPPPCTTAPTPPNDAKFLSASSFRPEPQPYTVTSYGGVARQRKHRHPDWRTLAQEVPLGRQNSEGVNKL